MKQLPSIFFDKKIKTIAVLLCVVLLAGMLLSGQSLRAFAEGNDPTLEVRYYNLSYSSEIYLMYAVRFENVDPQTDEVRMLFWNSSRADGYLLGTEEQSVRSVGKTTIGGEPYLVFYSDGLAPKQLTDTVYCRACVQKGGTTYYSEPVKYSPMKYIKTVLEGNYAREDKDLVSALRAYGNAAQVKFNYHTERLAATGTWRRGTPSPRRAPP